MHVVTCMLCTVRWCSVFTSAKEFMFLPVSSHPFVRQQDYAKTSQVIFVKSCRIMDQCYVVVTCEIKLF